MYLKTHIKTNLKYLGQTTQNPSKYKGSGLYWSTHLEKHGNHVITEILLKTNDKNHIEILGKFYSEIWNVVKSDDFANLIVESGSGGSRKGRTVSPTTREKLRKANIGKRMSLKTIEKVIKTKRSKGINIAGHLNTSEGRLKQIRKNRELMDRKIVENLRNLAKIHNIKLGSGWTRKSDEWIFAKIKNITNHTLES